MRDAILADGDELAIDHGVAPHVFESLSDLAVYKWLMISVAAVQSNLARANLGDHPKAVEFVFEDPFRIVERSIGQRSQHRLQALG